MNAISRITEEPGMGQVEAFPLPVEEKVLFALCKDAFENHWDEIVFGTHIQGAVFEIRAPNAPRKVSLLDGYLTVDFGPWHFHLCIGPHKGTPGNPTDPELARIRRTGRAEFYRVLDPGDGKGRSWGIRFFNGQDEQQMTIFLPNPFLSKDGTKILKRPDWSHLALWDALRERHLGLSPDERDRGGKGFRH
jgi:hypothetical protein